MHVRIVEDDRINLAVLARIAAGLEGCTIFGHSDPQEALEACLSEPVDLVLVDYQMPAMNGVEFIRRLRADPRRRTVPAVMITGDHERALRLEAMAVGATDFVTKPVDPEELKLRARNLLALRAAELALADRARLLETEVRRATQALLESQEEVIDRLARAIEHRDGETGEHVARVAAVSRIVGEALGLEPELLRDLHLAAPLHDVGKLGVPDAILNKPGRLSPPETAEMRRHVEIGAAILSGGRSAVVRTAERIAQAHHERWDGGGYPAGLAGPAIPLEARIVALADVLDALCSPRPYKRPWPAERARAEIRAQSGTQFDPACVAAMERAWDRILPLFPAERGEAAPSLFQGISV